MVFHVLLGVPEWAGILIGCGIVLIYTTFGGMQSVIVADIIQFILLAGGMPLLLIMGLHRAGGAQAVLDKIKSTLKIEEGKDLCTLVTCTPYGINSHRLLIRGTRIPYDGKYAEKVPLKPAPAVSDRPAEEQGRKLGTRQWILFAIAAFGVAILLGILAPSGKKKGKASSKTEETADQRNKELSQNSKAEKKEGSHEKNEEEK